MARPYIDPSAPIGLTSRKRRLRMTELHSKIISSHASLTQRCCRCVGTSSPALSFLSPLCSPSVGRLLRPVALSQNCNSRIHTTHRRLLPHDHLHTKCSPIVYKFSLKNGKAFFKGHHGSHLPGLVCNYYFSHH